VHEIDLGHLGEDREGAVGSFGEDDGRGHGTPATAASPAAQQALRHAHVHPELRHLGAPVHREGMGESIEG
jgi:hypothetical protein